MKSEISKAQLDVWEWKEKAYSEIKHLKGVERLKFILAETATTVAALKKKSKKLRTV
jgi:hypothetical protein